MSNRTKSNEVEQVRETTAASFISGHVLDPSEKYTSNGDIVELVEPERSERIAPMLREDPPVSDKTKKVGVIDVPAPLESIEVVNNDLEQSSGSPPVPGSSQSLRGVERSQDSSKNVSIDSSKDMKKEATKVSMASKGIISQGIFSVSEDRVTDDTIFESDSAFRRMLEQLYPKTLRFFLRAYSFVWFSSLVVALFGGSCFTLCRIPDDPGVTISDTLMTSVMVFFLFDLAAKSVLSPYIYFLSFFFWMDVIGTGSMVFEISYLLGDSGKEESLDAVDPVFARSARAAKVGARAGRFMKVLKCIEVFYGRRKLQEDGELSREAKVLSAQLMISLAKRVSVLTVLLVLGVPLFSIGRYPEEDQSLYMGALTLEDEYYRAYKHLESHPLENTTDIFSDAVLRFRSFFDESTYFPFRLQGFPESVFLSVGGVQRQVSIPGSSMLNDRERPVQGRDVKVQRVRTCKFLRYECDGYGRANVSFDFETPNMLNAGMDIAVVFFIVTIMLVESFDLTHTIDLVLVKPMERMLGSAQLLAAAIMQQFDDESYRGANEIQILELVMKKLAMLAGIFVQDSVVTDGAFAELSEEGKGVIIELMQQRVPEDDMRRSSQKTASGKPFDEIVVINLPFDTDTIKDWSLDLLSLEVNDLEKVVLYICFESQLKKACRAWMDSKTFTFFHEAVVLGYSAENPYHNYRHAVDVVCSLHRVLCATHCQEWVTDVDQFALLISALCHDIGHTGKTNPFLVETKHELALRYNDKSPLENMHCARLFEICKQQHRNIFKRLKDEAYKQARKVCISSILHTDNANHFDMVKEVQRTYTVYQELCDDQPVEVDFLASDYAEQVLCKETTLWLNFFLHFSDIGNPMKPFEINKAWAWFVQDEFFAQGDEEKKLGVPVGMLNDRDKVNRAGGEHGFIVFLVAPLVLAAAGVMPMLEPNAIQVANNLQDWKNFWIDESSPSKEDIAKREADVKKLSDQVAHLTCRRSLPTPGGRATIVRSRAHTHETTKSQHDRSSHERCSISTTHR